MDSAQGKVRHRCGDSKSETGSNRFRPLRFPGAYILSDGIFDIHSEAGLAPLLADRAAQAGDGTLLVLPPHDAGKSYAAHGFEARGKSRN